MVGIATFTMKKSRVIMKVPARITIRVAHSGVRRATGAVGTRAVVMSTVSFVVMAEASLQVSGSVDYQRGNGDALASTNNSSHAVRRATFRRARRPWM